MKTIFASITLAGVLFGQTAPGIVQPRVTPRTIDFYIATTGSDSNACTSTSKCLTLAHALALIPQTVADYYVIHVADGTYSESINTAGFIGMGLGTFAPGGTPYATGIEILGNTTTPSNVIFDGSVMCDSVFPSIACISGSAMVVLHGLEVTGSTRNTFNCQHGTLVLNKVNIVATNMTDSDALLSIGCQIDQEGDVNISGFVAANPTTAGCGIQLLLGSVYTIGGGTLTITGPASGTTFDNSTGIAITEGYNSFNLSGFTSTPNVTINQVGTCFFLNGYGVYQASGASTTTCSNSATPMNSVVVNAFGASDFELGYGANLTIDHYTLGFQLAGKSLATQGLSSGTRTFTNLGSTSSVEAGATLKLY